MLDSDDDDEMRCTPQAQCYLCGSQGSVVYSDLKDSMTDLRGAWSFRRCAKPGCGLIWLDPMPIDEDIHKAYRNYFTHGEPVMARTEPSTWQRMAAAAVRVLSLFVRRSRAYRDIRQEHLEREATYLGDLAPGRLLEIGCGNGSRLVGMKALGWDTVGQEVDPEAAAVARSQGMDVRLGSLKDLRFEAASFDAVVMVHVIEHLRDPVADLSECLRILKPGGRLIAISPNARSYGHRRFGAAWQGLDPPRHMYVFTPKTLKDVALRAGFVDVTTWTTEANSYASFMGSLGHRLGGSYLSAREFGTARRLQARAFQYWAVLVRISDGSSGEECVLRAIRRAA